VNQVIPQIVAAGCQCVFLNREALRKPHYGSNLKGFATQYASHIRWYEEYDPQLEHKILAGADFLLLPSKSEPCGELQMYSLKYGTIPIARATGGLDDTIVDFSEDNSKGNGIKFSEYTPDALMAALREALAIYQNPALWELIKNNAMRANYSWVYSAKKYLDLYKVAMGKASLSPITLS
jgi:starch synthase